MKNNRYDLAIVGGGIAGLAIAEIFSRSGRKVVLLERNQKLCQEASASQHGWFHFGSLYSIFPQNHFLRTLVRGVEDLLYYYKAFPSMNIKADEAGQLVFPESPDGWFRDEPLQYIVAARNNHDFELSGFDGLRNYGKKLLYLLTWEMALKQFISRHQRFHRHNWNGEVAASEWIPRAGFSDYSRDVIIKPNHLDFSLDVDTHFQINGYDRPMRASSIINDLTRSFLGAGGVIETEADVKTVTKSNGILRVETHCGDSFHVDNVVITTGRWLDRFLRRSDDVKVVASPLLVTYPAITERNFVRMTPFVEKSINHICHEINGIKYSVIGGGHYAAQNADEEINEAKNRLLSMAGKVFPNMFNAEIMESYVGFKTEFISSGGERNYQYLLRQVDEQVFAAIPGKFSLAFSLAVNTFKKITGESPSTSILLGSIASAENYIGLTKHAKIIHDRVAIKNTKE